MLTRFAPSPTGFLHLGHARSAFEVWHTAARTGSAVRLRIEDIDQTRCKPEYDAAILEDLIWLGLIWQGDVRRQSDHFADYARTLDSLRARGLIYRCFRTRAEIAAQNDAAFTGEALPATEERARLDQGDAFAWRLSLSAARRALGPRFDGLCFEEWRGDETVVHKAVPERLGDVVLARKDAPAAYHLACCHDDALQGVTRIIRGEDLRDATHVHVLLQALMDWPTPFYQFHPLLLAEDGRKLAKRDRDKPIRTYRAEGVTPQEIRRMSGAP